MQLDEARGLKAALNESVILPMAASLAVKYGGLQAQPTARVPSAPPTIALGITRGTGKSDFAIAVRLQNRGMEDSPQLRTIRKQAKGEVDVRYVGLVTKLADPPWHQKMIRPLKIGASIGHYKVTAGTLGGFVRDRKNGSVLILSNNHVLANENKARKGDPVLQPGAFDGGENPAQKVGEFVRTVKLKREGANLVDCAVATIDPEVEFDHRTLAGMGRIAGLGDADLAERGEVDKIGRTTGKTAGRITAFEVDSVIVEFGLGLLRFASQVEIEGAGADPFSQGGDSGSLIVDADRLAVGLLFAGSDQGGTNGKGLAYANSLRAVLDELQVDLFLA